jgi:hypothetical protein
MPLTKLQFRPGVNRETTAYTNEGGWFDGNRVRFREGSPETIGGWTKESSSTFIGSCRALIGWRALDGTQLLGVGTDLKYFLNRGGTYSDITPIRLTTSAGAVTFSAVDGSTTLTVTHTSHGAVRNDFVTFSGAASLGGVVTGVVLNAEHQIANVLDADTYEITLSVAASAGDSGNGGASVVGVYQISTGLDTSVSGSGWGAGAWSAGAWGEASDTTLSGAQLRIWAHTNYGEDLVFAPRGGPIYYWNRSDGFAARGVDITTLAGANNSPTVANIVTLSERDRHLLVFGTDDEFIPGVLDPLLIRFSSQESLTDWETRPNNTAGSLRISSGSEIIAAVPTKQLTLAITDTSVHAVQFIGPPFTFGLNEVSFGTTIAGPNAAVSIGDEVLWMGKGEFYRFNGLVQQVPCDVQSYVFDNINVSQYAKVYGGHNSSFGEVWWFYPSAGSPNNDRYVVYNYLQDAWYYGAMARTAWIDRGVNSTPISASLDGYLYYHETGITDGEFNPAVAIGAYIESSPVDLGDGDSFMFISRMIPDMAFNRSNGIVPPNAVMTIKTQNFSGGGYVGSNERTVTQTATVPIEQFTEQVYLRLRGRAMTLRVSSTCSCTAWRLGSPRVDIRPDGRRG